MAEPYKPYEFIETPASQWGVTAPVMFQPPPPAQEKPVDPVRNTLDPDEILYTYESAQAEPYAPEELVQSLEPTVKAAKRELYERLQGADLSNPTTLRKITKDVAKWTNVQTPGEQQYIEQMLLRTALKSNAGTSLRNKALSIRATQEELAKMSNTQRAAESLGLTSAAEARQTPEDKAKLGLQTTLSKEEATRKAEEDRIRSIVAANPDAWVLAWQNNKPIVISKEYSKMKAFLMEKQIFIDPNQPGSVQPPAAQQPTAPEPASGTVILTETLADGSPGRVRKFTDPAQIERARKLGWR